MFLFDFIFLNMKMNFLNTLRSRIFFCTKFLCVMHSATAKRLVRTKFELQLKNFLGDLLRFTYPHSFFFSSAHIHNHCAFELIQELNFVKHSGNFHSLSY